ncbi:hypothetical protein AKJ57_04615 [candidate division MSBL1 archaeon SCGC-AAA259A05]|uniref:Uncharacterized protein n=1 Tax=candidate division MSBL1 archaeon SCGC-AAA259A05 TaxID=1698259 RepID=A0A133U744_9EURY|nr:hypothetical protein AKJ57_04615 [candidate division MSBL1 archaeon SCGC-AAA259A05]
MAGHKGNGVWKYVPKGKQGEGSPITDRTLPIITIPSTSGTGSHVTPYAVITDPETGGKPGFGDDSMFPDLSIVDVDILREMPERLTAATGFDVFTHVSENIVAKGDHPISDLLARRTVEIVSDYLPRALEDGSDMEAREMMALADTCAGLSNTASFCNLRHGMVHSISGHYPDIAHGQALASVAVPVMEFNLARADERTRDRYAEIAGRMGGEEKAGEAVERLKDLIEELGLDKGLSELGVKEKKISQMTSDVFSYMENDVENNPVPVTREEIGDIYRKSF